MNFKSCYAKSELFQASADCCSIELDRFAKISLSFFVRVLILSLKL